MCLDTTQARNDWLDKTQQLYNTRSSSEGMKDELIGHDARDARGWLEDDLELGQQRQRRKHKVEHQQ